MSGRGFLIKYVIELKEGVDMRKILVVIDMQNDFIDAALGTKEAVAIVDAVKEKKERTGGRYSRISLNCSRRQQYTRSPLSAV